METLLAALRACAEPTRLRLLALGAAGAFCVSEFTEILGQSQPRLSRHLKLLCDAGLLDRQREGANVWFAVPPGAGGALARELLARLPADDPVLAADRREAARVLAERARIASESFQRQGAEWDETRALDLPAAAVEAALLAQVPPGGAARVLDIGTGTGRVLELLAPSVAEAIGIDASAAMLALARARLARAGLANAAVRRADMYRLPFADAGFDLVVAQMVLHYAEAPGRVLAEAARVLTPGGRLVVIDLAAHRRADLALRFAHRWQGFAAADIGRLLAEAGLAPEPAHDLAPTHPGGLPVLIWTARAAALAPA